MGVPKGWPDGVAFIVVSEFDVAVHRSIQMELRKHLLEFAGTLPPLPVAPCKGPCPNVRIRLITERQHPAAGQRGLFAAKTLAGGAHVIDYVGRMSDAEHESKTSDYTLRLSPLVSLDAERCGNESRHCNDYRGIRCQPNCKFDTYLNAAGQPCMGIFVLRGAKVQKGEELCVSYGKAFWSARGLLSRSIDEEHGTNVDAPLEGGGDVSADGACGRMDQRSCEASGSRPVAAAGPSRQRASSTHGSVTHALPLELDKRTPHRQLEQTLQKRRGHGGRPS